MKIRVFAKINAFTLAEMIIAVAIITTVLAVTLTSSVALQKSFSQIDNYSSTHMQQIRIVDYLARDVRRGLSVTSSIDRQTVTIAIPKYIYQAGDSDLPNASFIGTPRPPKRAYVAGSLDPNINYGATTNTVQYSVQGSSILRKELKANGTWVTTTIASSTDNLVPETTDIELSNTEYTTTAVTFKPISVADRTSTSVYSTAYLRNRRRPPSATPTPAP